MKNTLVLAGSIIIAGAFIGGGVYLSKIKVNRPVKNNTLPEQTEIKIKEVQSDDHIRGSKSAKVIIIEYSDPECPYCKIFHSTLMSLFTDKELGGKIAWVYRHFPLDSLHKKARYEAQAFECAGEIGGNDSFWRLVDKVYEVTPSNDGLDDSMLPEYAEKVGLPKAEFSTCLNSNKYSSKIESQFQEAVAAGGTGTPYSIIIGPTGQKIPVPGAVPFDSLKIQIQSLLNLR